MAGLPASKLKRHWFGDDQALTVARCGIPREYAERKGTIARTIYDVTCRYCVTRNRPSVRFATTTCSNVSGVGPAPSGMSWLMNSGTDILFETKPAQAADAVDPSAASTGTPTPRDGTSSSSESSGGQT